MSPTIFGIITQLCLSTLPLLYTTGPVSEPELRPLTSEHNVAAGPCIARA